MPDVTMDADPGVHVRRLRRRVDDALGALELPEAPSALYDPVRYVLSGGGKRFRPLLLLLAAELFDVDTDRALPAALSVELFHNFTLVHDDIMDHADERRGRPTVHRRWDEGVAILCGDYMMGLSYELLARVPEAPVASMVLRFQRMVARLCEGQTLDRELETRDEATVEDYLEMIDGKTGALLQASLELGGLVGGASPRALDVLGTMGHHLGRAFQIQDDLLDLTADHAKWGKVIGGDLVEGKKTFLVLRALELAEGEDHRWFARILRDGGLPRDEVPAARARMERLGVLAEARSAVGRHTAAAIDVLGALPPVEARRTLRALVERMQGRTH